MREFVMRENVLEGSEDLSLRILNSVGLYCFNDTPKYCGGTLVSGGYTAKVSEYFTGSDAGMRFGAVVIVEISSGSTSRIRTYHIREHCLPRFEGFSVELLCSVGVNG